MRSLLSNKIILFVATICTLISVGPKLCLGDDRVAREAEIKLAFLYNFANFVEWPESAFEHDDSPITLCVLSQEIFEPLANLLDGQVVGNRTAAVRKLDSPSDLETCQILYLPRDKRHQPSEFLAQATDSSILTVSDVKGFASFGGMIEFIKKGNRLRFEINISAAEQVNLRVSSRLLKLATKVIRAGDN